MISDMERARPNNRILVSRNRNCSRMTAGNTSGYAPHQYDVSTAIERWGLAYRDVDKVKW